LIYALLFIKYSISAWWNFCVVGNYAARFYSFAMKIVRELQYGLEKSLQEDVNSLENLLKPQLDRLSVLDLRKILTQFTLSKGEMVTQSWRDLFPLLVTTYRDGYVMKNLDQPGTSFDRMFYPKWWLDKVGFFDEKPNKDGILFSPHPISCAESGGVSLFVLFGIVIVTAMFCLSVGLWLGLRGGRRSGLDKKEFEEVEKKIFLEMPYYQRQQQNQQFESSRLIGSL
jgi:hypothetical protein